MVPSPDPSIGSGSEKTISIIISIIFENAQPRRELDSSRDGMKADIQRQCSDGVIMSQTSALRGKIFHHALV
jgi:hypothetical protein